MYGKFKIQGMSFENNVLFILCPFSVVKCVKYKFSVSEIFDNVSVFGIENHNPNVYLIFCKMFRIRYLI